MNEEGKYSDEHLHNELATAFWAQFDPWGCIASGDYIAGTAVIMGGCDEEGSSTDAPDKVLAILCAICGLVPA